MNRKKIASLAIAIVIIISAFALLVWSRPAYSENPIKENPSGEGTGILPGGNDEALTSLEASITAQGVWEKSNEYNWTIEKSVFDSESQPIECPVELDQGQSIDLIYDIYVEKSQVACTELLGAAGTITVKNVGCNATQGLTIMDTVQTKDGDGWKDYESKKVDVSSKPQLAPGESYTYSYELNFVPISGAEYRNLVKVTITNFEDHEGCEWGVEASALFSMPCQPTVTVKDNCAQVTDEPAVPEGFCLTLDQEGPWEVQESQHIYINALLTNVDAECGTCFTIVNKVHLVESCSGEGRDACVSFSASTGECQCGRTTIEMTKEATGYWNQDLSYIWSLTKEASPSELCLKLGESESVTYTITATRSVYSTTNIYGVFGLISIKNIGDSATVNLVAYDEIWYQDAEGAWNLISGEPVDVSCHPVLAAGECYSYEYDIQFVPPEGAVCYKNVAYVHIDNSDSSDYYQYCAEDCFSLPCEPTATECNACADVVDVFGNAPNGFKLCVSDDGAWHFCDSGSVQFQATICNEAACGEAEYCLVNTATLTTQCGDPIEATECVAIHTHCYCACGATLTIGYWMNHDGTKCQADMITPLIQKAGGVIWLGTPEGEKSLAVTNSAQASDLMSLESQQASNGIIKLYAQLLAAKLNILNGACPCAIGDSLSEANAFLASHSAEDWNCLTLEEQQTVLEWKTVFDNYNNGVIGPGHLD